MSTRRKCRDDAGEDRALCRGRRRCADHVLPDLLDAGQHLSAQQVHAALPAAPLPQEITVGQFAELFANHPVALWLRNSFLIACHHHAGLHDPVGHGRLCALQPALDRAQPVWAVSAGHADAARDAGLDSDLRHLPPSGPAQQPDQPGGDQCRLYPAHLHLDPEGCLRHRALRDAGRGRGGWLHRTECGLAHRAAADRAGAGGGGCGRVLLRLE